MVTSLKSSIPEALRIVETALYVKDLAESQRFYERVCGFRRILEEPGRLHALAIESGQVLLLFEVGASTSPNQTPGGIIPPHSGYGQLHLAFGISRDQITAWRKHLTVEGVAIESEVNTPMGGTSIYFRDPDSHLIELVTPGTWTVY